MSRPSVKLIATGVLGLALSATSIVPLPPAAAQTPEQRIQKLEADVKEIKQYNEDVSKKLDDIISWIKHKDRGPVALPPQPTRVIVHRPIYVHHVWRPPYWRCPPWWWYEYE